MAKENVLKRSWHSLNLLSKISILGFFLCICIENIRASMLPGNAFFGPQHITERTVLQYTRDAFVALYFVGILFTIRKQLGKNSKGLI